jgi:hypothetical protein
LVSEYADYHPLGQRPQLQCANVPCRELPSRGVNTAADDKKAEPQPAKPLSAKEEQATFKVRRVMPPHRVPPRCCNENMDRPIRVVRDTYHGPETAHG